MNERAKGRRLMIIFNIGIVLVFSAHNALLNLQSSINIDGGLGTLSLATLNAASLISGVLLTPIALQFIDIKAAIVANDVILLSIIAANFYPVEATLLPTFLLCGLSLTIFWVATGALNIYFAKMYANNNMEELPKYISNMNGYFFGAYMASQLVGNLIPYAVFELTSDRNQNETSIRNFTISEVCGANDCQDAEVVSNTSSQYHPSDPYALYYVLIVFLALDILGTIAHIVYLPKVENDQISQIAKMVYKSAETNDAVAETPAATSENDVISEQALPGNEYVASMTSELSIAASEELRHAPSFSKRAARLAKLREVWKDLKSTWWFFLKPRQLLLCGSQVLLGLNATFAWNEITRAYVSCAFGVAQVGISMSIYGTLSLLTSVAAGRVSGKLGRMWPMCSAFALNFVCYMFALFWIPDESSSVAIVFALIGLFGLVDGVYLTLSAILVVEFMDGDQRAFTSWTTMTTAGYFTTFAWSTILCVDQKLYIQIGVLLFSALTYGIAEFIVRKASANNKVDVTLATRS